MENGNQTGNNKRPRIVLLEDWFVCGKKLRFVPKRVKEGVYFDIRINERIFDKPQIKTVVWGNV